MEAWQITFIIAVAFEVLCLVGAALDGEVKWRKR